jgi:hypothetical protein
VTGFELVTAATLIMSDRIMQLNSELKSWTVDAFQKGYAAGYAARDKLLCANCGDGGKVDPK